MWKLWDAYGGGHLYVPRAASLNRDHPLAHALGLKDALTFCDIYGGQTLTDIPLASAAKRKLRNLAIVADRAHMSPMALGRKYHLTERAVYLILAAEQADDDPNYDLFA